MDSSPLSSSTASKDSSVPQQEQSSKASNTSLPVIFEHKPALSKSISEKGMQNYCYRHHPNVLCNRQADATQMKEIQSDLDKLDDNARTAISHVWSIFSAAPSKQRSLILKGLLAQCCFPQLSQVSSLLDNLIRIDFISALPPEISFKILSYLDSTSLCRAAQVNKKWKLLADDDVVWHRMCEQHIDKKCTKCGWGLPLLEKKRLRDSRKDIDARVQELNEKTKIENETFNSNNKRPLEATESTSITESNAPKKRKTRPWKEVYRERYNIESNWRNGRYKTLKFQHKSPVLCLQFDDQYLMVGTYDGKVSIWDVETGKMVRQLEGHSKAVSALKFDNLKLITASRDQTVRVWNYRNGDCVCTFRGHEDAVLCIDCDQRLIASGSADRNIKVWNFATKTCFTLRGHTDWVQSVRVHSASGTLYSGSEDTTIRMWDLVTKQCVRVFSAPGSQGSHVAQIQSVIPLYIDHLQGDENGCSMPNHRSDSNAGAFPPPNFGRSQSENPTSSQENSEALSPISTSGGSPAPSEREVETVQRQNSYAVDKFPQSNHGGRADPLSTDERVKRMNARPTHILSASLDSTIKMWDVKTGQCVRTLFGHIEGIWGIAADNFRVVSASHDKLVKVWDLQSGRNWHTFNDHTSHVSCVGLSDTRLASGSDDGEVQMLCFDDFKK